MGRINEDTVAEFLLENEYYLTALEFHQELYENNITTVQILRKFFARPPTDNKKDNISEYFKSARKSSITVEENQESEEIDYKTELQKKDEQIRVLEYELRRSKEDIELLKKEVEQIYKESGKLKVEFSKEDLKEEKQNNNNNNNKEEPKLKQEQENELNETERKSINYSIQYYLVSCGYKLTTITFADEVSDQDLTSWQKIGLISREPPSLLNLYRYFYQTGPNKYLKEIENELEENRKLLQKYKENSQKTAELETLIFNLQQDNQKLRKKLESGELLIQNDKKDDENLSNEIETPIFPTSKSKFRLNTIKLPTIRDIDINFGESAKIFKQIQNVSKFGKKAEGIVLIIGDSLPNIIPSVLLKSRKDVIPVLLIAIQQHPEPKVREELTRLLFNLIKKPDLQQRQMIMAGCVALAQLIGKDRVECELLPQCWEEIASKYEERRVLVADSCGSLAAYTKSAMRISFILSILMEQLEDKSALVREAVAKNLAQLISFFETDDKYLKLEEMLLKLFYDQSKNVVEAVRTIFIPIFAEWSDLQGIFFKNFVPLFVTEITKLLKYIDPSRINDKDGGRIDLLLQTTASLVPKIYEIVIATSPFDPNTSIRNSFDSNKYNEDSFGNQLGIPLNVPILNDNQLAQVKQQFDDNFPDKQTIKQSWPELKWLIENFLTQIINTIVKSEASESPRVTNGLSILFNVICGAFGTHFTKLIIKPLFKSHIVKESYMISTKELQISRIRVLPVFILGVMTSFDDKILFQYLKKVSFRIALEEMDWTHSHLPPLLSTYKLLCTSANKADQVLDLITTDLKTHVSSKVRLLAIHLYDGLVQYLSVDKVEKKVFPSVLQFTSDVDHPVRIASIKTLGIVGALITQDNLFEKLNSQVELILTNASHQVTCEILQSFTKIIPNSKPAFRDACILPKIIKLNEKNNQNKNTSQREEVAKIIFDTYRSLDGCVISQEVVSNLIIPGLKLLKDDVDELNVSFKGSVARMLKNMQSVVG